MRPRCATLVEVLAGIAILTNAVIYGADALCVALTAV